MVSRRLISGVVLLGVLAAAPAFAADGQRPARRRRGGPSERGKRSGSSDSRTRGSAFARSRAQARPGSSEPGSNRRSRQTGQHQPTQQSQASVSTSEQHGTCRRSVSIGRARSTDYAANDYVFARTSVRTIPTTRIEATATVAHGHRAALHHASVRDRRAVSARTSIVRASASASTTAPAARIRTATRRAATTNPSPAGLRRPAHHRRLADGAGFRRRLLRRHRERLRRRVPAPEPRGRSAPDRDREPGLQPITFDVMVQPGRTITFRADGYVTGRRRKIGGQSPGVGERNKP